MSSTLDFARNLIRQPSLTPDDAGCQDLIAEALQPAGFNHGIGAALCKMTQSQHTDPAVQPRFSPVAHAQRGTLVDNQKCFRVRVGVKQL